MCIFEQQLTTNAYKPVIPFGIYNFPKRSQRFDKNSRNFVGIFTLNISNLLFWQLNYSAKQRKTEKEEEKKTPEQKSSRVCLCM